MEFNGAARKGKYLNDILDKGPKYAISLLGVMLTCSGSAETNMLFLLTSRGCFI